MTAELTIELNVFGRYSIFNMLLVWGALSLHSQTHIQLIKKLIIPGTTLNSACVQHFSLVLTVSLAQQAAVI